MNSHLNVEVGDKQFIITDRAISILGDGPPVLVTYPEDVVYIDSRAYPLDDGVGFKSGEEFIEVTRDGVVERFFVGEGEIYALNTCKSELLVKRSNGQICLFRRGVGRWLYEGPLMTM